MLKHPSIQCALKCRSRFRISIVLRGNKGRTVYIILNLILFPTTSWKHDILHIHGMLFNFHKNGTVLLLDPPWIPYLNLRVWFSSKPLTMGEVSFTPREFPPVLYFYAYYKNRTSNITYLQPL